MEKNVIVVDEFGNNYGATYPKRAKGLVKKGRARFIDENTICLACPPANSVVKSPDHENLEDIIMSDNNTNIIEQEKITVNEVNAEESAPELTIEYVLKQIKAIQDNDAYLYQTINEIAQVAIAGPGDIGAKSKAEALSEVVSSREETNRKLIDSYMKMYESLTAEDNFKVRCLDIVATATRNPAGGNYGELNALITTIKNI